MTRRSWGFATAGVLLALAMTAVAPAGAMDGPNAVVSRQTAPPNDDFADAGIIPDAGGDFAGTNVDASYESGEPSPGGNDGEASVWWRWTAPASDSVTIDLSGSDFDTMLGVYTGSAVDALAEVASDYRCGTVSTSMVAFQATAGTVYHILVNGYFDEGPYETDRGNITGNLTLPGVAPIPSNDDFADAVMLPGEGGTLDGSNCFATHEVGEPRSGDSVWWQWTAPGNGTVDVDLQGSNFDTFLAMYTGGAVDALSLHASNDDEDPRYDDLAYSVLINVAVYGGTTYHVAVDGSRAPTNGRIDGDFVFSPPSQPNDFFSDAEVIPGVGGPFTGSNAGASVEPGEPDHAGFAGRISAWWQWTATGDGTVAVDLEGSALDAVLAVYTGDAVGALTEVASNYDSGEGNAVDFAVTGGVIYRIAVDEFWDCNSLECSYPPSGGSIIGNLAFTAATCNGMLPTIIGTDDDDIIDGTSGDDVIVGLGGNDVIDGKGGDDSICGGPGSDALKGSAGDDTVLGEEGADTIIGGKGNDDLRGGGGDDSIDGSPGDDRMLGGRGHDTLRGGAGNDLQYGQDGNDRVKGGAGDDELYGGLGNDIVNGQTGNDIGYGQKGADRLFGFAGDDDLRGGGDHDRIVGGAGFDTLDGGAGDDLLLGGGHDDVLDGAKGYDDLRGQAGTDTCLNGELLASCEIV